MMNFQSVYVNFEKFAAIQIFGVKKRSMKVFVLCHRVDNVIWKMFVI